MMPPLHRSNEASSAQIYVYQALSLSGSKAVVERPVKQILKRSFEGT